MRMGPKPRPAIDRFMDKIMPVPESGCWIWMGRLNYRGYGMFRVGSKVDNSRKLIMAHQFSYEHFKGPRNGLHVLHSCDIGACCNPNHLRLGTPKENMQDAIKRGQWKIEKMHSKRANNGHFTK